MDIKLVGIASPDVVFMDWLLRPVDGAIAEGAELTSAVLVAILSDAPASSDDQLPDPRSDDLRGWWGDSNAKEIWGAWPLGSKLWLLTRSAIVDETAAAGATITRVQQYIAAPLQPFVDNRICSNVSVTAQRTNIQTITAHIIMYRGPKKGIALQFQAVWTEQLAAG